MFGDMGKAMEYLKRMVQLLEEISHRLKDIEDRVEAMQRERNTSGKK